MKKPLLLHFFPIAYCLLPVHANGTVQPVEENRVIIRMTVGQRNYDVELASNPTTKAFIKRLPLTLTMQELNGNEKFADLPHALPSSPTVPEILRKGDLMLYGCKTLVLFYQTFQTSYGYTSVGRVVEPDTLQDAVGRNGIKVNFSRVKSFK